MAIFYTVGRNNFLYNYFSDIEVSFYFMVYAANLFSVKRIDLIVLFQ